MRLLIVGSLLFVSACSGVRYVERTGPVSPHVTTEAPRSTATGSITPTAPIDEAATRAWLDKEIELAPRPEPPVPMVQVVERVVDTAGYDPYLRRYPDGYCRSSFPWNTALGAGIGAVIGHQSGEGGRGAWIGGGIGYLLDITTCW